MRLLILAAALLPLAAQGAKPEPVELQLLANETRSAKAAAETAQRLLGEKGYQLAKKPVIGDAKTAKNARVSLRMDVMKPANCFVSAEATNAGDKQSFWVWQTPRDLEKFPCDDQVKAMVDAFAARRPPAK